MGIAVAAADGQSLAPVVAEVQPKIVKIYGAGGLRGLESYQSGIIISPNGDLLTAWSYVLDSDQVTAVLDDGRRFAADLVGADPEHELALLRIEAEGLPYFDLDASPAAEVGTRVLAFSNLFGVAAGSEPASVQFGTIAARTSLAARRGGFQIPYRGPVYVLDAMTNNPGAAGGALTNQRGELLAILGKELRHAPSDTWLNYAIPVPEIAQRVAQLREGKTAPVGPGDEPQGDGLTPGDFGIVLVPDVLAKTPPYVDRVRGGSAAARAGLKPDDLIIYVDEQLVASCQALSEAWGKLRRDRQVRLLVNRGNELINLVLELRSDNARP